MAYDIEYDPARNLVKVKHYGNVDRNDLWSGRTETMKLLQNRPSPRVLVDLREIKMAMTTLDEFDFAQSYDKYFPHVIRVAVLISKYDPKEDEHRFMETVAQNRGYLIRIFNDQAVAEKWLMEQAIIDRENI